MGTSLKDYITFAQKHFNRREYEQFILPIIKLLQEEKVNNVNISIRSPINNYMNNCIARISNEKEILNSGEEMISIENVVNILQSEKSLIV